ncbi:hypothetical protein [Streptomyces sp. NPDC050145]|uniref:hypothetical protein n=1 Tax=Streptomyces sp. NPDC050145 TaxID=3365602 RepID=UPI00378F443D
MADSAPGGAARPESAMKRGPADWVSIIAYENLPGSPGPMAALRAWLRARGIDWMPFDPVTEIRVDLACAPDPDAIGDGGGGHWRGWYDLRVSGPALRRLGLHPDQPTAHVTPGSFPPGR